MLSLVRCTKQEIAVGFCGQEQVMPTLQEARNAARRRDGELKAKRMRKRPGRIATSEVVERYRVDSRVDNFVLGWREAEAYHLEEIVRGDWRRRFLHAACLLGFGLWLGLLIGRHFGVGDF